MKNLSILMLCVIITSFGCKKEVKDIVDNTAWDTVQINKVQVLASHNSYRKRTYDPILQMVMTIKSSLPASLNPEDWDYTHIPLPEQFNNYGVRSIELDVYYDHDGGRFYNRAGMGLIGESVESGIPQLKEPGYKILHIPDVDFETNYYTFKQALETIKDWSNAHPRHLPIYIYVETKQETAGDRLPLSGFVKGIPYTPAYMDELDAEIKAVFGADLEKVVTPDKFRGSYATLREAALANNWPTLKEARGKIIFVMNGEGMDAYRSGKTTLEGRAMFVFADSSNASDAAFIIRNAPIGNEAAIASLVKQGFMVRTRADHSTEAARNNDYTEANAAFASGAQIVSTDYYRPDYRCDTSSIYSCYSVKMPNGKLARVSPAFANYSVNADIRE